MAIDKYVFSFEQLVTSDLPQYMAQLESSVKNPRSMDDFAVSGVGIRGICRQFSLKCDFPGCYVLLDGPTAVYVGISGNVLQRLRQHVRGATHFDASLAYRIACDRMPHKHTRSRAMEEVLFKAEFDKAKAYLRSLQVAYVEIDNPLVLYVFEPYCAMRFDTSKWNTFETH
jgi:predicted GIY-YIG superfamily endonuclease